MSGSSSAEALAAGWLSRKRQSARSRFEQLGVPKASDEDWRQTNLQPIAPHVSTIAPEASLSRDALERLPLASTLPCRAVLVNGRFDPSLSSIESLPRGVQIRGLAEALAAEPDAIEPHLGAAADADAPFVALNTASFTDGIVVTAEPRIECLVPIHIVHVAVPGSAFAAIHPRVLVVAAAGSRLTVIETFLSHGTGGYLTNAVTEIVTGDDAGVTHVKVQSEGPEGWHVAAVSGRQARSSTLVSHNVSLGAALARNDIGSTLAGTGAECRLYGLYLADGTQHVDNHTWLDHAAPHCPSWEMYKGLLAGTARAVFCGRIHVREGAQKTDAKQSNKNLILGDGALVFTRPQLTIHANDVKCTHGATIGRLDEDALFYLRSRGIDRADSHNLLVRAFAGDLIENIPAPAVRTALSAALSARLEARS